MDNELDYLESYIDDARLKIERRHQLREINSQESINYPEESKLELLDSSIKKNSAFVKKLKTFSEGQRCQILDEIDKLNLTKFISEAAASITEAKFRLVDIPSVIEICTKLNRIYRDFHKHLLNQYSKCLPTLKKRASNESIIHSQQGQITSFSSIPSIQLSSVKPLSHRGVDQSCESSSKLRVDLRLFAELLIVGVLPLKDGFQLLASTLYYLMISDQNLHHANAILILCKGCGDELLGLIPARVEQLSTKYQREIPTSDYITTKRQNLLRGYLKRYLHQLSKGLCELHQDLRDSLSKNQKICKSKGEVSKEAKEILETKCVEFQKLQNMVLQFSEILNETAPDLSKINEFDSNLIDIHDGLHHVIKTQNEEDTIPERADSIWDDDGTRAFYEDLLDLRQLFPKLQVKISPTRVESDDSLSKMKFSATSLTEVSPDTSGIQKEEQEDDSSSSSSSDEAELALELNRQQKSILKSMADRTQPDQYFSRLSNCVNRDMIDNAAIDFIKFFNTKFGRKKLIKTLFSVQRTRLDLLPFFARLAATINPFVPSIGADLANQLKSEFRYLFKKKDQINIESKVKNVRYLGEFVKFNLVSKQEVIGSLKMLLSDFTHHHIEMTCNLLETCGRLLYRSPDSHRQMKLLLEQMMRKKMLLSVDSKYVTMIENAYYITNPPEIIKQIINEPPIQLYVRYLLYECLNRSTIDTVLRKLKLLDWSDKNLAKFVINRMIEAYNVKFYNIRYFAALLAALNKDHPWISIAVIDGVVEDILLMMEINEIQFNQRRIPMIRYFGELFNYRLSDSSLVFKVLYSLITYGVVYPDPEHDLNHVLLSPLDPPDNLFRVKLICDLLDTSGQYLNGSQEKKKLDCYLLFFQRYYWCKKHIFLSHAGPDDCGNRFPALTEYLYNDTIFNLRPNFLMATSYTEAIDSLQSFIDNLQIK